MSSGQQSENPRGRRRRRNTITYQSLIGSKWTSLSALEHEKYYVVTGWANTATDVDGAPDSVIIEAVDTGRTLVVAWRSLRNGTNWVAGWT